MLCCPLPPSPTPRLMCWKIGDQVAIVCLNQTKDPDLTSGFLHHYWEVGPGWWEPGEIYLIPGLSIFYATFSLFLSWVIHFALSIMPCLTVHRSKSKRAKWPWGRAFEVLSQDKYSVYVILSGICHSNRNLTDMSIQLLLNLDNFFFVL